MQHAGPTWAATPTGLGSGQATPVTVLRPALGGVLVVGTDGLFTYAAADAIATALRAGDVKGAADRLAALVRLPSGGLHDGLGIAVVVAAVALGVPRRSVA